jgi:hypothetical protein
MLQHLYMTILHPCEDMYRKNIIANQQKAASRQTPSTPARPAPGPLPNLATPSQSSKPGQLPANTLSNPSTPQSSTSQAGTVLENVPPTQNEPQSVTASAGTGDIQNLKRKADVEEPDGKRTRPKTGAFDTLQDVAQAC